MSGACVGKSLLLATALGLLAVGCKDDSPAVTWKPATGPAKAGAPGRPGMPAGGPSAGNKWATAPKPPAVGPRASRAPLNKNLKGYAAVQDLLNKRCIGCHGAGTAKDGIKLADYASVMKGGREGAIVIAGKPDDSLLVKALKSSPGAKPMPPKGPLPSDEVKIVEDWVKGGAKA